MKNKNYAIELENKIKKFIKTSEINVIYNNHVEIFEIDIDKLQNIIKKIDDLSLDIINKNIENNYEFESLMIEKEKTKQLEIEKDIIIEKEKTKQLELQIEFFKLTGKNL